MSENYTAVSAAAKNAARDIQRTRWVINLEAERRDYEKRLEALAERQKSEEKALAIAEYKVRQGEETSDPRVEDYKKGLEATQKSVEGALKRIAEDKEDVEKEIERVNKEIAEVSDGTRKVSYEKMVEIAKQLVEKRAEATFTELDIEE